MSEQEKRDGDAERLAGAILDVVGMRWRELEDGCYDRPKREISELVQTALLANAAEIDRLRGVERAAREWSAAKLALAKAGISSMTYIHAAKACNDRSKALMEALAEPCKSRAECKS